MTAPRPATRVFLVEDSAVTRRLLTRLLEEAGDFEVVGTAADGIEAVEQVVGLRPDVVTMDIHLPGIDGIEATRRIVQQARTPVLVVTGSSNVSDGTLFEVLDAGALGLALRPLSPGRPGAAERRDNLLRELRTIARVSRPMRVREARVARPPAAARDGAPIAAPSQPGLDGRTVAAIGIAASTGGPAALKTLLEAMPPNLPPTLVVQHMSPGFVEGFAAWLSGAVRGRVSVAVDGEPLSAGRVLIAPDDRHLVVDGQRRARLLSTPPVSGHRPSGDVLLRSFAETFGPRALGVVLTGMGRDGAEGLEAMRRAGGITLAQDRASSVVYGMPAASAESGAAQQVLPIEGLAGTIRGLVQAGHGKQPKE